ncbi:phosphate butyryltransferase [Scopulibacillus cellulosilyticus]|uniref:Phosphate butyryltransferase n=1 Tax=Scopulibacillus cellulosilyticus TaxID=2665665 RepID=A0ABW2PXT8_9BACL
MSLEQLKNDIIKGEDKVIAVAQADDIAVLQAVTTAVNEQLGRFILFGPKSHIEATLKEISEPNIYEKVDIVHTESEQEAAAEAVRAVSGNKADVLMKGLLPTAVLLKAVLNKEYGIRSGKTLSHVAAFEVPGYKQLIFVTDPGMNITPDLEQKADIINNAVQVARSVGCDQPKVALLAAVETVNPKMPATVDAAVLTQMNRRGQITNCIVDGPLALDNAVSLEAAAHKKLTSPVAGQADILVVPNIEAGNMLYKSLVYFSGAKVGAIVTGAKAPIILTSRSDTPENKLTSILLAVRASF